MTIDNKPPAAPADDQSKALDDAIARVKKEKELEQLKLDLLEIQRKTATASVTATAITPLTGETTVGDTAGYPLNSVAYHALRCAAQEAGTQIRARLAERKIKKEDFGLLVVDTLDMIPQLAIYGAVKAQISQIDGVLSAQLQANETARNAAASALAGAAALAAQVGQEAVFAPAATAMAALAGLGAAAGTATNSVAALAGLTGAVAGIAALFRRDYKLTGRAVDVKQDTARIVMAEALVDQAGKGIHIAGFTPKSALTSELAALIQHRLTLAQDIAALTSQVDSLPDTEADLKSQLQTAIEASTTLIKTTEEFLTKLTTPDAAGAPTMLAQALRGEQLSSDSYTHILYVHIESTGGDIITEKNLWRTGRTTFLGGAVLNYALIEKDGRVFAADSVASISEVTTVGGKGLGEPTNVLLGARDLRQDAPTRAGN